MDLNQINQLIAEKKEAEIAGYIEKLQAALESQSDQLKKQGEVIALNEKTLSELVTSKASSPNEPPTVKVDKKTYAIVLPSMLFEGRRITAKDVQENKELAAALVKRNSGMLQLKD